MSTQKTKSKKWHIIIFSIVCFFLIAGFMFLSVDFIVGSKTFYNNQFAKNNTAEEMRLSTQELSRVRDRLIAYFSGKEESIQIHITFDYRTESEPFYTEDEMSHMHDVKLVFKGFRILSYSLLITGFLTLILFAIFLKGGEFIKLFSIGAKIASAAFAAILIIIGISIAIFWQPLFTVFHEIFFPQGNWSFSNSNMIDMLPGSLFMDAAILIVIIGISAAVLILTAGIISGIVFKKRFRNKS